MQTNKKWIKADNLSFTFWNDNKQIGTMEIALGTTERKAIAKFENQNIVIRKAGFWNSNLELTDPNGQVIAKVYNEKWYASSFILEYNNRKYKLIARNNPLAEWALQDNNQDLLAYGLSTQDGKVCVSIKTTLERENYLFDFILWYLFLPIATEQSADDFTFLMLTA
jgi:hypothetical protein